MGSAPLTSIISGPVRYGDGAGGNLDGCSLGTTQDPRAPRSGPFPPGSLTGLLVLVDRGACNFTREGEQHPSAAGARRESSV